MTEPQVGIVIGSDTDLPVMKDAALALQEAGIAYEIVICSAHRLPEQTATYARRALDRGLGCIIAGAGGAAHLPGVLAALTTLPVIGVPIALPGLGGLDALLSIAQMPRGVPVATVAINGAYNAGLLAAQLLAAADPGLHRRLAAIRRELGRKVEARNEQLQRQGWEAYLRQMQI